MRNAWLSVLIACLAPVAAAARSDLPLPADLLDARTYPGIQGILELRGANVHNVGNIWLHVTNFGLIGSQPGSYAPWSGAPSAQWPAGRPTEYLWSAGPWIGALKDGVPRVTTGQYDIEFRPGKSEQDRIYRTHEQAPGGARRPAANADDDHDGRIDEDWLDGRDNDGDGKIDEDFAAVSNQMFVCEYRDDDPAIQLAAPEHVPLGILVRQSSMAWEDALVDDSIAFDFRIVNRGLQPLEQVYAGIFADCDIGPRGVRDTAEDDRAGFWEGFVSPRGESRMVKLSLGYMWDDDADGGSSEGYIGLLFLGAEPPGASGPPRPLGLLNYRAFSGRAAAGMGGDPTNDSERYAVLDGTAQFSLPDPDPRSGLRPSRASRTGDYRFVVSAGPLGDLSPGDTLGFQAALVIGPSFAGLQENALRAQVAFEGVPADCDNDTTTGVDGRESPRCGPGFAGQYFLLDGPGTGARATPCVSGCEGRPLSDTHCYVQVPEEGCIWIDADCDGNTGVGGKECIVNWLLGLPPPPPSMRLIARENEVDILFDNRSQTALDPRLRVSDFESYRIWRADNWQRPSGSDVGTGPGAELWMLLAEYDVPYNHIGADTGLEEIRYDPAIPAYVIEFYREWYQLHPLLVPPALPGFTQAQLDTAQAMGKGARYYRYVDPPFIGAPRADDPPCAHDGGCAPLQTSSGWVERRCDQRGRCRTTAPSPHPGAHYFYSVTATDHQVETEDGRLTPTLPGLQGDPQSNFVFVELPSDAVSAKQHERAAREIYVVPNPATPRSLAAWRLEPNNEDPTGSKIEFRHVPAASGRITIFTLAGDRVKVLPFDGRNGDGTVKWDLLSRNGQEATSGVYLFVVESDAGDFERFVGKFAVVR